MQSTSQGKLEFWCDKGIRLKSERNLSLTMGLKVLYNEYRQCKEDEVEIISKECFDKSLTQVGKDVEHVCMIIQWSLCGSSFIK